MKVLIAEDDSVQRRILKKIVSSWGYTIIEASDGKQALDIIREDDPPRLVILDWNMPRIDGLTVCAYIREADGIPFIYPIILTARKEEEDKIRGLQGGAYDYIIKPYNIEELRCRIEIGRSLIGVHDKVQDYVSTIEEQSLLDPLTQIGNRRYGSRHIKEAMGKFERSNIPFSLIMFDIDNFKEVNDTFGHDTGDEVLCSIVKQVISLLRGSDKPCRWGGEEFLIILENTDSTCLMTIAEKIRTNIEELKLKSLRGRRVTISLGVTSVKEGEDLESVLKRADEALYTSKNNGRNKTTLGY